MRCVTEGSIGRWLASLVAAFLLAAFLLVAGAGAAHAAPGDLDPSFSLDGMDVRDLGTGGGYRLGPVPSASALDSQGRLLVLGSGFLARVHADGHLDRDFGRRGLITTDVAARARTVGVDAENRIYLAGQPTYGEWDVTRLTPLGVVDKSYGGGDGVVAGAFTDLTVFDPRIVVEPGGRATIAAYCSDTAGASSTCLVRLTAEGAPAAAFSGDGQNVVELGESEAVTGVAVDTLGRLVLSGSSDTATETGRPTVARVTTAGVLDGGFGSGGIVRLTGIEGDRFAPLGLTTDGQNRVLVAGGDTVTGDTMVRRFTTGGQPDTQFDDDGVLTDGFDDKADYGAGIDVDHAGRIVVAGTVTTVGLYGHTRAERFVARYGTGGEPDATFGEEGMTVLQAPVWAAALQVHVDGEGRPHVAGYGDYGEPSFEYGKNLANVQRITSGGELDEDFNGGVFTEVGIQFDGPDWVMGTAVDRQGRTLVVGYTNSQRGSQAPPPRAFVLRYTAAGNLDPSFGDGGVVLPSFFGEYSQAYAVTTDPQSRVLVAIGTETAEGSIAVMRLTAAGAPDPAFGGGDGIVGADLPGNASAEYPNAIAVDGSRIAVAATQLNHDSTGNMWALRFGLDGTPDAGFPPAEAPLDGQVTADAVRIDELGRVVVAGLRVNWQTGGRGVVVARFTGAGALDNSFSGDGRHMVSELSRTVESIGMDVDSAERIVIAGLADDPSGSCAPAAVRLTASGGLDSTFSGDGILNPIDLGGPCAIPVAAEIDGAGRILLAGSAASGFGVARLEPDGDPDTTFAPGGVTTAAPDDYVPAAGMAVAPDGRIVVAGVARALDSYPALTGSDDIAVARFVGTAPASKRALSVRKVGTGGGTVTGTGIQCGTDCDELLPQGTQVTLTANAASGSTFAGWSSCDSVAGAQCTVTLAESREVHPTFDRNPVPKRTLTVELGGSGSGSVTGQGISCPGDCTARAEEGTEIVLTAEPTYGTGTFFTGWTNCPDADGATCTVTLDADMTVTATFGPPPPAPTKRLTVNIGGSGSVTGPGISCPDDCVEDVGEDDDVTLQSVAASGYHLVSWEGCDDSSSGLCELTMATDRTVKANFAPNDDGGGGNETPDHIVSVLKSGFGDGTVSGQGIVCGDDCSESVPDGVTLMLNAFPGPGSTFGFWQGCDEVADLQCTITVGADRTVLASFDPVTSGGGPTGGGGDDGGIVVGGGGGVPGGGGGVPGGGGDGGLPDGDGPGPVPPPGGGPAGAPVARIIGARVSRRTATFRLQTIGGEGPVALQCKLDKGKWKACGTRKVLRRLKSGRHVLRVRALDARGVKSRVVLQRFRVRA